MYYHVAVVLPVLRHFASWTADLGLPQLSPSFSMYLRLAFLSSLILPCYRLNQLLLSTNEGNRYLSVQKDYPTANLCLSFGSGRADSIINYWVPILYFFNVFILRQGLNELSRLALKSLCRTGRPSTYDFPASASQVTWDTVLYHQTQFQCHCF